ncbi:MAG: phospholipid carrier-dependent glycosyltransferase [Candidatus Dojkabacteria bacterium]|nr:phospholipid carrier-dependent glycosyltransferase [Candidatus Dojkabacteria bacterium]
MEKSKSLRIFVPKIFKQFPSLTTFFLFFIVLFFSFGTRFYNLGNPKYYVFDENYFIPMSQKYIRGEFFGDPHPPTGKLLITAGAYLYPDNVDEGKLSEESPSAPSENLVKYRYVPAFFSAILPLLVFMIIFLLTKSSLLSFLGSFLVTFDNAILVHGRFALFDEILFAFVLISFVFTLLFIKYSAGNKKEIFKKGSLLKRFVLLLLAGIFAGLALSTKMIGLTSTAILSLGIIYRTFLDRYKLNFKSIIFILAQIILPFAAIFVVFYGSFAIHFKLLHSSGANLEEFSQGFQNCITKDRSECNMSIIALTNESIKWSFNYESRVPSIDFCKEGEMGSTPSQWPFMGRAIAYSFSNHATIPLTTVSYVYLTGNPIVWYSGLLGVVFGFSLLVVSFFLLRSLINKRILLIILAYFMNYAPYFFIQRVMYFYHYFPALIFSIILLMLLLQEFKRMHLRKALSDAHKSLFVLLYAMFIFVFFLLYSPLSYNRKIDVSYVRKLIFSEQWNLRADPYNYNPTSE